MELFYVWVIIRFSFNICLMIIIKGKSLIDSKVEVNIVRNFVVDINLVYLIFVGISLRKCVEF